jgi:hypothetical protein
VCRHRHIGQKHEGRAMESQVAPCLVPTHRRRPDPAPSGGAGGTRHQEPRRRWQQCKTDSLAGQVGHARVSQGAPRRTSVYATTQRPEPTGVGWQRVICTGRCVMQLTRRDAPKPTLTVFVYMANKQSHSWAGLRVETPDWTLPAIDTHAMRHQLVSLVRAVAGVDASGSSPHASGSGVYVCAIHSARPASN